MAAIAQQLGSVNAILRARARQHQVHDFPGPLSIKSVIDGSVTWSTGGREIAVNECAFLVLNAGEPYSMDIDEIRPVTTCCVFFERGFVESVHRSLATPEERILDEPFDGSRPVTFLSRLHPADGRILPRMQAIHRAAGNPSAPLWIEQQYVLLARDLLALYQEVHRQVRRLPAARAATRGEIFRRLSRARESRTRTKS